MLGSWNININKSGYPQKVASALSELNILGAEYTPIAYLGSQEVNGINHAVLAEQLVLSGKDTKNVVVLIFNEKPNDVKATLVNVERVVESGGELGGIKVDVKTEGFDEATNELVKVVEGFVGSKIEPFALLGTQVTKGINYIFAAKLTPVVANPEEKVGIVIANSLTNELSFVDILGNKSNVNSLGYAFTWLRR